MYWPEMADRVEWLLLATDGSGLDGEALHMVDDSSRLTWLGYELVRRPARGRPAWTWRRPKDEMAELHALVASQASQRHYAALAETLGASVGNRDFMASGPNPGRCVKKLRRGYEGELPYLFHVQKISHGERLVLSS